MKEIDFSLTFTEMNALLKLLHYIKFTCEDEEEEESFFENVYGNKIGGNPSLLQEEDYYFSNLKTNNFDFIFQFDESSYQKGQVKGNKPFLNGIIYFYGKINNHKISNIIVGFWQKG